MKVESLPIARIYPREDIAPRKVDEGRVADLVESIRDVGLLSPISVRPARRYVNGVLTDAWEIVAGHHRYEAMYKLGKETIAANVIELDDMHAELATIDENLMRAELSPAQEAAQIARRKEIYEAIHPETVLGANQYSGRVRQNGEPSNRFTKSTAKATGKSEREIQRAAQRGRKIGADNLAKIEGTSLDKGSELDALAKLPKDEQNNIINLAASGKVKTVKKKTVIADDPINDLAVREKQVAALMAAWNKAGKDAREEFLSRIDKPVMDARFG